MRRDVDAAVAKTAEAQWGAFSRDQVYAAGGDARLAARRVAAGSWRQHEHDVFVLAASRESWHQALWVALLAAGPGALVGVESAAEEYTLNGVPRGRVVVLGRHSGYIRLPGATIHQLTDVLPHHRTERAGMPITTPARTIVDLAAVLGPVRLRAAIESAVVGGLASFGDISGVLADVRRRGKPGVRKLVGTLDGLGGEPPPASALEAQLARAAELAGVRVVRQYRLPWAVEPVEGLVDFAVPDARLILEADGRRWHARLEAMAKDRRRDRAAARAGWLTLRFMHEDLRGDLAGCAAEIRDVARLRSRR